VREVRSSLAVMPEEKLPASWATEYFRREGTVGTWWDPLSDSDPDFRRWFVAQLEDIVAVTRPGGRKVLDAAVGRGRATVAMAEGGARSVVALDISAEMLSIAASNLRSVPDTEVFSFVQGDLHRMPFEDESFEIVLLLEVLLHVADPLTVLRECHRVLEPNGVLVVTTNGANPLGRLLQPSKRGSRPASRFRLFTATLVNEAMTAVFGFTWRRLRVTGELYQRFFRAPVRPLYPHTMRRSLREAGFRTTYHRSVPSSLIPREHRWFAVR
jgi:ubiquinone/menaquinone biosynthesis C-methylase UbiE